MHRKLSQIREFGFPGFWKEASVVDTRLLQTRTADDADKRGCARFVLSVFIRAYRRHPRLESFWLRLWAVLATCYHRPVL